MNSLRYLCVAVLLSLLASSSASAADVEKSLRLPVLSVSGEPAVGICRHLNFHYIRRDGDRAPLSIAVIEDTPGGAGESIRASIWLAAMVAALERHDPLSGVRLSLELPGQIDGPSAGAVICLAILSALDGREFPKDCAATGSVMPDGTIGGVGSIAEKLKAASRAGVRRVFAPAYLRFERAPTTGEEVDLKRLASSLKVELIAAENVGQAYRLLHHQPAAAVSAPERTVLELPVATEEVLKRQYQEHRRIGTELWNAIPQTERDQIVADPTMAHLFVEEPARAERAYRSGKLINAVSIMGGWRLSLAARQRNQAVLRALKPDDLQQHDVAGSVAQMDRLIDRATKSLPEVSSLAATNNLGWSESSAQFYSDFHDLRGIVGYNAALQQTVTALVTELARADLKPEERKEYFGTLVSYKAIQLFTVHCAHEGMEAWQADTDALVRTLPRRPVTTDVTSVERLFHSAHLAVKNSFRQDVIRSAAALLQLTDQQTLDRLTVNDGGLAMHLASAEAAEQLHVELAGIPDLRRRRFATVASTHLQAVCLGNMSGVVTRWHELDVEMLDGGELRYGRTDLLSYLLTTARENALAAIAECRAREIPCVGPIGHFESGELSRDDVDTDKVDVLTCYWSASLEAKALLMLCSDTTNEPAPKAAPMPSSAIPMGPVKDQTAPSPSFVAPPDTSSSAQRPVPFVQNDGIPYGVPRLNPRGTGVLPTNPYPATWKKTPTPGAPQPKKNWPNGVSWGVAIAFWLFWIRKWCDGKKPKKTADVPSETTTPKPEPEKK